MMTDDAMPADEFMLKRLVAPLSDSAVAVSYARHIGNPIARPDTARRVNHILINKRLSKRRILKYTMNRAYWDWH